MTWASVKDYLSRVLDADPLLLDYIAVYDILKLCAEGRSNLSISHILAEDLDYVESVVLEFYGFSGFQQDLDFNVNLCYNRYKYNLYAYLQVARTWDLVSPLDEIRRSYNVNKIFEIIDLKVNSFYAN